MWGALCGGPGAPAPFAAWLIRHCTLITVVKLKTLRDKINKPSIKVNVSER